MQHYERLLENSEPWLHYAIRFNLMHTQKEDLLFEKSELLNDPRIQTLLREVSDFHSIIVKGHKNPDLPIHKLLFLLELGLDTSVPEIQHAIDQILLHKDEHGIYQSKINIPTHYGGSGVDTFGWSPCDAPLLLRALCLANVDYQKAIKSGVDHLISLNRPSGFPCVSSQELGNWRGPGRKEDGCPYATLILLKLLLAIPEYKNSSIVHNLADVLLNLWRTSMLDHPYMFYMGTDFRKLKAPSLWYDILSVCDALSQVESIQENSNFKQMLSTIFGKQDIAGMFTPESIYLKCKEWDFGQKKNPSQYLTYLIQRINDRIN